MEINIDFKIDIAKILIIIVILILGIFYVNEKANKVINHLESINSEIKDNNIKSKISLSPDIESCEIIKCPEGKYNLCLRCYDHSLEAQDETN